MKINSYKFEDVTFDCPFPAKKCLKEKCLKNCFPCVKPVVDYFVLYLEFLQKENKNGNNL